jgi:YcxB-like protein
VYNPSHCWAPVFKIDVNIHSKPSKVTFGEDGVHAQTSTYDLTRKWIAYSRLLESKQLFLLVYGKRLYATITKKAPTDEKQIELFREMVKSKIGSPT